MVGIEPGEYLAFVPTGTRVLIVDDSTIGYMGDDYKLSSFAGKSMPSELRNPSDVYQGYDTSPIR